MRLSKKQQKAIEKARDEVREGKLKTKRVVKTRKPRAKKGTTIPNNQWIPDHEQGFVYVNEGRVHMIDVDHESGKVTHYSVTWDEYNNRSADDEKS